MVERKSKIPNSRSAHADWEWKTRAGVVMGEASA
jgi:hypothetical protein